MIYETTGTKVKFPTSGNCSIGQNFPYTFLKIQEILPYTVQFPEHFLSWQV